MKAHEAKFVLGLLWFIVALLSNVVVISAVCALLGFCYFVLGLLIPMNEG